MPMPKYMMVVETASGNKVYRYNPPKDAVTDGVVKREAVGADFEAACAYVEKQNAIMDEWRRERKYLKALTSKSTVEDLVKSYLTSKSFEDLNEKTKIDYQYYLKTWYSDKLGGVSLPNAKIGNIMAPMCQRVYDDNADRSVSLANHALSVYRLIFNYGIRKGFTTHNPFSGVKKRSTKPRKIVWERHHVRAFLNTAFSDFEWRNVGVIVNMAYEWGQRLGDMRELTWDEYNIDTGILTLTQSKRGANIQVPTSEGLQKMLAQQHRDFGWQKYIAPAPKSIKGKLYPYSVNRLNRVGRRIMGEAQLPPELLLMDLRRTAITEMVEVGVPVSSIMAVSGHATPMSLSPYIKHTLRGATTAQTMRDFPKELMNDKRN